MRGIGYTYSPGDLSFPMANPPAEFITSLETIAPNVTALVDETRTDNEAWYETLVRLLPAIAATDQQRRLLNMQADRARAGLPPMDTSQYGLGVRVGLSEDSKQLLIYGGLALAALVGFGIIKLGRR